MNTLHNNNNVDAWIRMDAPIVRGRPFPYGEFSCTPLTPDAPGHEEDPVGFLLSRGNAITWVDPKTSGGDSRLWESLVEEMHHHHTDKTTYQELPPECWYG